MRRLFICPSLSLPIYYPRPVPLISLVLVLFSSAGVNVNGRVCLGYRGKRFTNYVPRYLKLAFGRACFLLFTIVLCNPLGFGDTDYDALDAVINDPDP